MKFSGLFSLTSFLLLAGAFASEKFNIYERHMRMYDLISTGSETLETVQAIFENATEEFNDDFEALDLLHDTEDVEVLKYILSKSVNMDPRKRAKDTRDILSRKLSDNFYERCQLIPGEPAYDITIACLKEIKDDNYPEMNSALDYDFSRLIELGNLPLVKLFVDAGLKVPAKLFFGADNIKANKIETFRYLVENGIDISRDGQIIYNMMKAEELTSDDFEFLFQHGLPLDYKFVGSNWLELALHTKCFDIAELFYNKGIRLSKAKLENRYLYINIESNIAKFAHHMAMKKAFDKAKLMLTGNGNGNGEEDSLLSFLPKEMIWEMIMPLAELEKEKFLLELSV